MTNSSPRGTHRHNENSAGSEAPTKTSIKILSLYIFEKKGGRWGEPKPFCRALQLQDRTYYQKCDSGRVGPCTFCSKYCVLLWSPKKHNPNNRPKSLKGGSWIPVCAGPFIINSIYHSSTKGSWISSQLALTNLHLALLARSREGEQTGGAACANALQGTSLTGHEVCRGYLHA